MKKVLYPIMIAMVFALVGCKQVEITDDDFTTQITLEGLGEEAIVYTLEDIEALEAVEITAQSTTSDGDINVANVKGVYVADLVTTAGYDLNDYESLKIVAGDGYEIIVPPDVLSVRDVIIAYEQDGEAYDEYGAFRTIIPDERAMYWVKGVASLNFEANLASTGMERIVFLDNLSAVMELEDYTYYDTVEQAVSLANLFQEFANVDGVTSVTLIASDGLENDKDIDTASNAYLKLTGEDAPLFTGPTLPKGMQIKEITYLKAGDTTFVALSAVEELPDLWSLLSQSGVSGTDYVAYDVEGEATTISGGIVGEFYFIIEGGVLYLVDQEGTSSIPIIQLEKEN
ncbi:MAG: hypothetical protein R3Y67_02295 [Eubacteriales bacterium]